MTSRTDSPLPIETDALVARQPIVDVQERLVGYELLFRHAAEDLEARVTDQIAASRSVLLDVFLDLGLDRIVGEYPAFLNLTGEFFTTQQPLELPKDRVILEILEGVPITAELIEGVRWWSEQGYRIALDDFAYRDEAIPLLELADIVKLDVLEHSADELLRQRDRVARYDVLILAEKVESSEQFEFCKVAGFDLFQGFFLCRPKVVKGQRLAANRFALLRLLARLQDPNATIPQIEELIREDVALCYKLLRLINSAYYKLGQKIESIRQTLVLLGMRQIRAWVSLLTLSTIDNKPPALIVTAMVRAKMCELLAERRGLVDPDACFTVGLFSILDALLDQPMEEILESLPLAEELRRALEGHEGPMGSILETVLAYERGGWDEVERARETAPAIFSAYLDAVAWAEDAGKQLGL